jgi:glycosyltransferase involved in cell wall biosynthesis
VTGAGGACLVVVVERYPVTSETFIAREIGALRAGGVRVRVATTAPAGAGAPPAAGEGPGARGRLLRSATALTRPSLRGLYQAHRAAAAATRLHRELRHRAVRQIHAHFLGMPAVVARLLAGLLDVPFSLAGHARDIFVPSTNLAALVAEAQFVAVCSDRAAARLSGGLPAALRGKVVRNNHGVPAELFALPLHRHPRPAPHRLLSVGRLVPKKGVDQVLRAAALARGHGLEVQLRVVGDGPEGPALRYLARRLALDASFVGAVAPDRVQPHLAWADALVLGCRRARDGDEDGIPNAMLEAMAAGLPVIASDGGAVTEVLRPGDTGWLAGEGAGALAAAIAQAFAAPDERARRARRARLEVHRRFGLAASVQALLDRWPSLAGAGG